MHRLIGFSVVCGWLLSSLAHGADEKYTVVFKSLAKGQAVSVERNDKHQFWVKQVDKEGTTWDNFESKSTLKTVYWEMPLVRDKDGEIVKLQRGYGEARRNRDDTLKALPYEGKLIVVEKAGDRFRFLIDGKTAVTGDGADELDEEFNRLQENCTEYETLFTPDQALKEGESWKLSAKEYLRITEELTHTELVKEKAYAVGHLKKAYKKDDKQYGTLVIHVEVPVKTMKAGGKKLTLDAGAKMVLQTTYEGCIDGSRHDASIKFIYQVNSSTPHVEGGRTFKIPVVYRYESTVKVQERAKK